MIDTHRPAAYKYECIENGVTSILYNIVSLCSKWEHACTQWSEATIDLARHKQLPWVKSSQVLVKSSLRNYYSTLITQEGQCSCWKVLYNKPVCQYNAPTAAFSQDCDDNSSHKPCHQSKPQSAVERGFDYGYCAKPGHYSAQHCIFHDTSYVLWLFIGLITAWLWNRG